MILIKEILKFTGSIKYKNGKTKGNNKSIIETKTF